MIAAFICRARPLAAAAAAVVFPTVQFGSPGSPTYPLQMFKQGPVEFCSRTLCQVPVLRADSHSLILEVVGSVPNPNI